MTKSLGLRKPRAVWSPGQVEQVRTRYPHEKTETIARDICMDVVQVYRMAQKLGLSKTEQYLNSDDACRLRRGDNVGAEYRFQKGLVPHNKGKKGISYPGTEATQFKKGHRGGVALKKYQPIGTERISKDGYLQRKTNDDFPLQQRWRGVHILCWEEANGPVPKGHAVVFRDGDKTNIVLHNLELVSRAELMKRNTIHNLPQELKEVLKLKGALNRRITCHERNERRSGTEKAPV